MFSLKKDHIRDFEECRKIYRQYRSLRLKGILERDQLEKLYQKISSLPLKKDSYKPDEEILGDLYRVEVPNTLKFFLDRFVNNELIKLLEEITDKKGLVPHQLDLYSQQSTEKHFLDWHTDREEDDLTVLGLCVPISKEDQFTGASFEIKNRFEEQILNEINPIQGDMYLFDIDDDLEHRTTPITRGERISLTYFFKIGGRRFNNDS